MPWLRDPRRLEWSDLPTNESSLNAPFKTLRPQECRPEDTATSEAEPQTRPICSTV